MRGKPQYPCLTQLGEKKAVTCAQLWPSSNTLWVRGGGETTAERSIYFSLSLKPLFTHVPRSERNKQAISPCGRPECLEFSQSCSPNKPYRVSWRWGVHDDEKGILIGVHRLLSCRVLADTEMKKGEVVKGGSIMRCASSLDQRGFLFEREEPSVSGDLANSASTWGGSVRQVDDDVRPCSTGLLCCLSGGKRLDCTLWGVFGETERRTNQQ